MSGESQRAAHVGYPLGSHGYTLLFFGRYHGLVVAMAIVVEEVKTGQATSSPTSVTSASLSAAGSNQHYLAVVFHRRQSVSSISGLGLTWSAIREQPAGRNNVKVSVWEAYGNGTSGTVTATMDTTAVTLAIVVLRISGLNASDGFTTNAGWNTNGLNGANSGGTDNNDLIGSLTTAVNNSVVFFCPTPRNRDFSTNPTTNGWTQHAGFLTGTVDSGAEFYSYVFSKTQATAGSISGGVTDNLVGSADWALIMVEAVAAATDQSLALDSVPAVNIVNEVTVAKQSPLALALDAVPSTAVVNEVTVAKQAALTLSLDAVQSTSQVNEVTVANGTPQSLTLDSVPATNQVNELTVANGEAQTLALDPVAAVNQVNEVTIASEEAQNLTLDIVPATNQVNEVTVESEEDQNLTLDAVPATNTVNELTLAADSPLSLALDAVPATHEVSELTVEIITGQNIELDSVPSTAAVNELTLTIGTALELEIDPVPAVHAVNEVTVALQSALELTLDQVAAVNEVNELTIITAGLTLVLDSVPSVAIVNELTIAAQSPLTLAIDPTAAVHQVSELQLALGSALSLVLDAVAATNEVNEVIIAISEGGGVFTYRPITINKNTAVTVNKEVLTALTINIER